MAAGDASDIMGYCVLNPNISTAGVGLQTYIPLLRGSRYLENPALDREDVAMGMPESPCWTQGPTIPALYVRTPLFGGGDALGNWFTAKRMNLALIPDTLATGLNPWGFGTSQSGLIKQNLGSIQYRFADTGPIKYDVCRMANLRIDWGESDPIMASFLLLMGGVRSAGGALSVSGGQPPIGSYFMSQGMSYNGTLEAVVSGSLSINANLRPDLTTQLVKYSDGTANPPDPTTGVSYPNDFLNDSPPDVTLDLVQKKSAGAAKVGPAYGEDMTAPTTAPHLQLEFNHRDGTVGNRVTLNLYALKPVADYTTNLGLARIRRTFQNIKPNNRNAVQSDYSFWFS